jgi:hypothetical protein
MGADVEALKLGVAADPSQGLGVSTRRGGGGTDAAHVGIDPARRVRDAACRGVDVG